MARARRSSGTPPGAPVARLVTDNPPPDPKRLRIPPEVMAWARRRPLIEAPNPFALPVFPPSVEPTENKLAQDSALTDNLAWAAQALGSTYAEGVTFIGYAALSALAQRPEYRIISEEIASEMTREWIEFEAAGDDDKADRIKELTDRFDELKVKAACHAAATGDGWFGRGHLYLDTGDTDDRAELQTPLGDGRDKLSRTKINPKRRKLEAVRPVEAVWAYPQQYESNDPLKPDWYAPRQWMVMGKAVHSSRFLTFVGRPVPDMLKPAYSFGGLSMSQMVKPYVDNWLRTRQSVSDLLHAFSVFVLSTDLASLLQPGGQALIERVDFFNMARDNKGLFLVNKDQEDFKNVSAALGGLHELQAQSQEQMASVSRIPLVKLLGIQPAGLNASSEGEIRAFYDWIKAFQEFLFRDHIMTIMRFVMLSLWGEVDDAIGFKFKDLWQLDEAAAVAVEKTKTDIDDANVAMGSITAEDVRKRLAADKRSQYQGLDLDTEPAPGPPGEGEGEEDFLPDPRDVRDPSEGVAARAGNLASPTGGFGES